MTIAGLKNNSGRLPAEDQNASVANHPYESRTRVFAVKERCLNHLTNGCDEGNARVGISPTILPLRVGYNVLILPAIHNAILHKTNQALPVYSASVHLGRYLKLHRNIRR